MKVTGFLDHCNINVTDIERSIKFYEEAVGLHVNSRMEAKDGSFIINLQTTKACMNLNSLGLKTIRSHTSWETTRATSVSELQKTIMRCLNSTSQKDGFVMKTMTCISTSSTTLTDIGSKFYR